MGNSAATSAEERFRKSKGKLSCGMEPCGSNRRRRAAAWPQIGYFSGTSPKSAHLWWATVTNDQSEFSTAHPLDAVYREHESLLRAIARHRFRIPDCDAEALVHDIFASFLERQPDAYDIKAFLIGSINNACRHYWRKRRHEEPLLPHHELTPSDDEAANPARSALRRSLGATRARRGGKCSETLRRYCRRDQSGEGAAQGLDTPAGAGCNRLPRCRKRPRQSY